MPNFLQEKMEHFKQLHQNMKQRKFTRKDAALGVSMALVLTTAWGLSGFNPGVISYSQGHDNEKKVSIAEFSKLAGPQQTIDMRENNPLKRKVQKQVPQKAATPTTPTFSPSTPFGGFGGGGSSKPAATPNLEKAKATFARHAALTENMKSLLNSNFSLKKTSSAPTRGNEDRFSSSFEYANAEGTVLEKFELMSIVRTSRMDEIKTAQQALDSLVEESQAIRVIESTDDYLIYDFAGEGGYQIGKIAVDDKGIYIFGYVNLTTSEMPEVLKNEWINHYRSDL